MFRIFGLSIFLSISCSEAIFTGSNKSSRSKDSNVSKIECDSANCEPEPSVPRNPLVSPNPSIPTSCSQDITIRPVNKDLMLIIDDHSATNPYLDKLKQSLDSKRDKLNNSGFQGNILAASYSDLHAHILSYDEWYSYENTDGIGNLQKYVQFQDGIALANPTRKSHFGNIFYYRILDTRAPLSSQITQPYIYIDPFGAHGLLTATALYKNRYSLTSGWEEADETHFIILSNQDNQKNVQMLPTCAAQAVENPLFFMPALPSAANPLEVFLHYKNIATYEASAPIAFMNHLAPQGPDLWKLQLQIDSRANTAAVKSKMEFSLNNRVVLCGGGQFGNVQWTKTPTSANNETVVYKSSPDGFRDAFREIAPDKKIVWHSIVNLDGVACPGDAAAFSKGNDYINLTQLTGGLSANICDSNYDGLLDRLIDNNLNEVAREYTVSVDPAQGPWQAVLKRNNKDLSADFSLAAGKIKFSNATDLLPGDVITISSARKCGE